MLLYSKHKNKANLGNQQQERSIQNPVYLMCKYTAVHLFKSANIWPTYWVFFAPPFSGPLRHNSHLLSPGGSSRWWGKGGSSLINKVQNNSINIKLSSTQSKKAFKVTYNSPIYIECQTQSVLVLVPWWKQAHQDDSNDTPQPIGEFQVGFPLLWIGINQDNP